MTQQDKDLLLRDLCARLPYGVILSVGIFDNGDIKYHNKKLDYHNNLLSLIELDGGYYFNGLLCKYPQFSAKPFLRTLSSLTQEERNKFCDIGGVISYRPTDGKQYIVAFVPEALDYLNSIHADYRGMIEKGLAIEVTEGNNPYK